MVATWTSLFSSWNHIFTPLLLLIWAPFLSETSLNAMSLKSADIYSHQSSQPPDNSWHLMCEMFHSDNFLLDASVSPHGCQLKCVVLESTARPETELGEVKPTVFFDKSVIHHHNLNDGVYCRRDHVCQKGLCVVDLTENNQAKEGILIVDVIDAFVPQKDTLTHSDAYVKVVIKNPSLEDEDQSKKVYDSKPITKSKDPSVIKMGKTKVVWDTDHPVFNSSHKMENVSISSTIFFEIFDKDLMGQDDFIASLYAALKTLLKEEQNHQIIKLPFLVDYFLRVKISWFAYEA